MANHKTFWAAFFAGAGAAALAGAWAMGHVAPQAVAGFFTLYPEHGHGALYPAPEIFHAAAHWTLIIGGAAALILAGALYFTNNQSAASVPPEKSRRNIITTIIATLVALHVVWYAWQMAATYAAYQRNYTVKFAGRTMGEKLRLCIGDYPDRWGALAAQTPPDARLLRHTRADITFLNTFIYPRLVFIYEGEEFSSVPPAEVSEEWLRGRGISHVLLSEPWEPGGPIALKSLEEFLRERGGQPHSSQRVD